jgi:HTH-type transcriptional regulator/antitoxin HigA
MTIKPIRNDDDLRRVFARLEQIFQAEDGTPEADERDVLVTLVEAYERKHHDFGPADPVEAIRFRMEQLGLTPRDLERYIGPSGRVSEVLNRKRRLSLRMVRRLHDGLKIPYETLLAAERMREAMQRAGEHAAAQGMNEATLDPLLADES